jgi:hypothetical protein
LSYVVGLGFLLLVSMVLSTAIQMITKWANDELQLVPLGPLMGLINEGLSFGIAVLLFWGLMRMGSGIKPVTKYLLLGSLTGAALFTIGKQALAWYLSTAAVVSAYGAAGSLVVVLMWFISPRPSCCSRPPRPRPAASPRSSCACLSPHPSRPALALTIWSDCRRARGKTYKLVKSAFLISADSYH